MEKSSKRASSKIRKSTSPKIQGKRRSATGKSPENNFFDTSNVMPKIDNKPPTITIDAYYKPQRLEADAQAILKIDAENYELVKRLNTIHRMGGSTDCWNREFKNASALAEKQNDFDRIVEENKELMTRIEQATGLYCTADLMREWRASRAAKESPEKHSTKHSKSPRNSKKKSLTKTIVDYSRPRCYFEVEIESSHRKLGKLVFQLFADVVPKTCENFLSFCKGYDGLSYQGTPFHRILPGYWCQGGDVEKFNGAGEASIYGGTFEDENFQLKHSERGILSTCGFDKNSNSSKFNLTFKRLKSMDGRRVVFGKVVGGLSTLKELEVYGTGTGKPTLRIVVSKCGVL